MSKTEKKSTKAKKAGVFKTIGFILRHPHFHKVLGAIFVFVSLLTLIAFVSYFATGQADSSIVEQYGLFELSTEQKQELQNWGGTLGAYVSNALFPQLFGMASLFLILLVGNIGLHLLGLSWFSLFKSIIVLLFATFWFSTAISFFFYSFYENYINLGGKIGKEMADFLSLHVGTLGTFGLLIVLFLLYALFVHPNTLPKIKQWSIQLFSLVKSLFNKFKRASVEDDDVEKTLPIEVEKPNEDLEIVEMEDEAEKEDEEIIIEEETEPLLEEDIDIVEIDEEELASLNEEKEHTEIIVGTDDGMEITVAETGETLTEKQIREQQAKLLVEQQGLYDPHKDLSNYEYPSVSLLKTYPNEGTPIMNEEEQRANKELIVTTLRNFSIEIESIRATIGPTITLYEIVPKAGTKISKIRSLESDIMLSLKATGIRIIAPIPGKGTVGIEVPNGNPQIVSMHSVIASKKFQEEKKYALPVALGRTITNDVFMFDLAKTPHLLVAGATGQGKSVGLNAIIASLLYKKHPSELKFVLVDPKMVEFSIYSAIEKHFMAMLPDQVEPIITESEKVIQTLNSLVVEMEERYKLLMKASCRNIVEYNDKFVRRELNPENGHRFLPYIVIVIDEFGDFIMQAGKEVEMPIARITQKARAVGMHMILATQRPSVNIITGIIKANVPARISFRVSSMIDSRTIIDVSGAQNLVGRGDLLYLQGSELVRVQCAFMDTPEVEEVVRNISEQQAYPKAYQLPEVESPAGESGGMADVDLRHRDVLFEEVARMVVASQSGSTSNIQRKFAIGYNRAGKLVDQLEAAGIVGPFEGSKPRQVLIADEYALEQKLKSL